MKKREQKFAIKFRSWCRANYSRLQSMAWETKQTTTDSIPFSAIVEHQKDALLASKSDIGFFYKISDESRGLKPFDGFFLRNAFAYVIIQFPKEFHMIDIETLIKEEKNSKRKSLTVARAREISVISSK